MNEQELDFPENGQCCLCGERYQRYGNNAAPLKDGRCCNSCNDTRVIPARFGEYQRADNHRNN